MKAIEKMYGRWGNYIPVDTRKQFEKDCLEAEQQIKELGMQIITKDGENQLLMEQIKELEDNDLTDEYKKLLMENFDLKEKIIP